MTGPEPTRNSAPHSHSTSNIRPLFGVALIDRHAIWLGSQFPLGWAPRE
jgi:hypothetical protein